jgi:flagellar motor switch/type III secretory pathway protein FliN
MNSFSQEVSRRQGALDLRRVDNKRWQVMTAVGNGRHLDFGEEGMHLEVFHPPWSTYGRSLGPRAVFDTAVRCRLGDMLSDGVGGLWCLLGGVPLPAPTATPEERAIRLSVALTRVPSALTAIIGPLALLEATMPATGENAMFDGIDPHQAFGEDVVEMMLRLTREDVTVYSRVVATPAFWLSLMEAMDPSIANIVSDDEGPSPVDEARIVSSPVSIAAGSLPAATLHALSVGDVVRLPTTFRTDGTGMLRIDDVDVGVRWRARSPQHVFEVTSVTRDPYDLDDESSERGALEQAALEASTSAPMTPMPPSAVDRVPVSVVAEIGTLTMSLASLRNLRIGTLIKLGGRGEDEVVLRAVDGPAIAYAQLVDIGGHVGLQISRLADA